MDSNITDKYNFTRFNEELEDFRPILIVLERTFGLITIFTSLITLFFLLNTKKSVEGSSRRFFIALTVADLQSGIICTIFYCFAIRGMKINDPYCMKGTAAVHFSLYVTFFLMILTTIDRYFAIVRAVTYRTWSTKKRFWISVIFAWVGAAKIAIFIDFTSLEASPNPDLLCLITVERFNSTLTTVLFSCINIPCTIMIIYAYVRIFRIVWKTMFPKGNVISNISARDVKATLILFYSVLLFILLWLPWIIKSVYFKYYPEKVTLPVLLLVYFAYQFNTMINPFLYARSVDDKKKIIKNFVNWICCHRFKEDTKESLTFSSFSSKNYNKPSN